ncbi:hypothetical protein WJR50_18905 [Catalinimonas sp. 4WD22]|uniref:hypothetical protein n=1 Tax=Catalinimonas locisalis TaxID=3133978 RepID=UPI003100AA63
MKQLLFNPELLFYLSFFKTNQHLHMSNISTDIEDNYTVEVIIDIVEKLKAGIMNFDQTEFYFLSTFFEENFVQMNLN